MEEAMNDRTTGPQLGVKVPLAHIDMELNRLWQAEAEQQNEPVIRASTLNLVIFTRESADFESMAALVPVITVHHPSRIILINMNERSESGSIEAFLTAVCKQSAGGRKQIRYEQITLLTGSDGEKHIPGAILPLLLPALPVILLWAGQDFFPERIYRGLSQVIDYVILSPSEYVSESGAKHHFRELESLKDVFTITDLQWARLTPWRSAVAQFFDVPAAVNVIENITEINITRQTAAMSLPALLLSGWIASRLGLVFENRVNGKEPVYHFTGGMGREVKINMLPSRNRQSASLSGVELISKVHDDIFQFIVEKNKNDQLETKVLKNREVMKVEHIPFSERSLAKLVCDELDFVHRDEVFYQTTETIDKMMNAKEAKASTR
jgi:glucose-6-phosphate dehydrogenase assembly protein OpcA